MKEFVSTERQMENVKWLNKQINSDNLEIALIEAILFYDHILLRLRNFDFGRGKVVDDSTYESHFPIFKEIFQKYFEDLDFLKLIGFNAEEIRQLKDRTAEREVYLNYFKQKLGINLLDFSDDPKRLCRELILSIIQRFDQKVIDELNKIIYFSKEETNRILNGIDEYLKMDIKNRSDSDKERATFLSERLYGQAFEIYIRLLKIVYTRLTGKILVPGNNKPLYDFFKCNYPLLIESVNGKLRNDFFHLNFDERIYYNLERVEAERSKIFVKSITAIIALNEVISEFFEEKVEFILNFMDTN